LVRADYGVDNNTQITDTLAKFETDIIKLEGNINDFLAEIQNISHIWNTFAADLGEIQSDKDKIVDNIYKAKVTSLELSSFDRLMQREVSMTKKGMQELRALSRTNAVNKVTDFVTAGYITINTLNTYYASSYDAAKDDFGAKASLSSNASSGSFQWLRDYEYHIHARVIRADGPNSNVTGFEIKTGHIKPSDEAQTTGLSITVPNALNNTVIADSTAAVIRWANSAKRSGAIISKQ
jgi:hypothetical protein